MSEYVQPLKWCIARTLPMVYDDSQSTIETLGKVLGKINDLIQNNNEFITELRQIEADVEQLQKDVAQLQQDIEDVKAGKYVSLYLDSIINWIDQNLQCLVARIVKFVCFQLDDSGYLKAYIPYTWKFLSFDTCLVYDSPDWGKLVLSW